MRSNKRLRFPLYLLGLGAMVGLACLAPLSAAPAKNWLSQAQIEKKLLKRCWHDVEVIEAGISAMERYGTLGWKFDLKETTNWQIGGELVTFTYRGIKIDTNKTPWRLDLYSQEGPNAKVHVLPAIFKFEGEDLIWVTEFNFNGWQEENAENKYTGRPTEFTSTKENRYLYRRLKPCDYMQTSFPDEPKKP